MSKKLPHGVKMRRLQERRKKTLKRQLCKLLGVKRLGRRKKIPIGHNPFPVDISGAYS